jgi:D-serine dehydratase
VAHVNQAAVCVAHGFRRILIANQVVGAGNIRFLADLLRAEPSCEVYCLADSVEGVQHLDSVWTRAGAPGPLRLLLEFGRTGWRTGVRTSTAAADVYRAIQQCAGPFEFAGVEAFEGAAANDAEAEEFLLWVRDSSRDFIAESPIFSAGGSSYLGPVSHVMSSLPNSWRPVVRSGCYVTHDHGIYAERQTAARAGIYRDLPEFRAALELWAAVQSTPDPDIGILTFGKRDCAYDLSLPIPIDLPGAKITAVNDQHAYLVCPDVLRPPVGAAIRLGISHPCTAFDKWRAIPVVDDEYNVIDIYETFF